MRVLLASVAVALFVGCSCSTSGSKKQPTLRTEEHPFISGVPSTPIDGTYNLWAHRLDGYPTDVDLSADGKALLVATIPNPDRPGGAKQNFVAYYGEGGRRLWRTKIKTGVKAQALSADGSLAVVTSYDDLMTGFNRSGKTVWKASASCRPLIVDTAKKIVCYHDDDSEPSIAFEVFDWNGKKVSEFPITQDILHLKISSDETRMVIGLAGGNSVVFSLPGFKVLFRGHVDGEIIDADVETIGGHSQLAILHSPRIDSSAPVKQKLPKLSLVDEQGHLIKDTVLTAHADQIELASDGSIYAYGNGEDGQVLMKYMPDLTETWRKGVADNSRYTSPIRVTPGGDVLLGFEDNSNGARRSYLLKLASKDGSLRTALPIESDEDAYLYELAYATAAPVAAAAVDDGRIAVYRY